MATSQLFNIYIGHVANLHIVTGVFINSTPIAPTPQVFPSTTVVGYDSGLTFEVAVPPSNGSVPGKTDVVITYEVFGNSCIGCQVQRIFVFDSQNIEECHDVTSEIIPFYLTGDDFIFDYLIVEEPNNILSTTSLFNCSQPTLGCSGTGDYQIEDDLIIDRDIVFNANANLDENITLLDDIAISVEQSSVAYFETYLLNTCDGKWEGITVESGSTLEMRDCIVTDANNAIVIEEGATLILDNVTFQNCDVAIISNGGNSIDIQNCTFESCPYGIIINGDPVSITISNNTFDGSNNKCVFITDNTTPIYIGPDNEFDNSNEGIVVYDGSADIIKNTFRDVDKSIRLLNSNFSKVNYNQIGFKSIGLDVHWTNFEAIRNDIGIAGHIGHHGIDVLFSDDFSIDDNRIDAVETAVTTEFSTGSVHDNRIGHISPPALGVDRFFGDDEVVDNDIFARYTPVRSNSTFGTALVKNNTMDSPKEGPIYIGGSTANVLENNLITAGGNGVFYLNSGMNTINCNDITAGGDAIEVNRNSDIQNITVNTLDASDQAVLIESFIGVQEHHGNIFNRKSITAAGGVDPKESRFVIDPSETERDPVNANPSELRDPQPREITYPPCVGNIGSDMVQKFQDPIFACNYLNNIETYKDSNPKYYWNAMYHMMRFYLLKLPLNNWPDCIIAKWNDSLPCGIKTLLTKETELKKGISSMDDTTTEDGMSTEEGSTDGEQGDEVSIKEIAEEQLVELSEVQCTEELYLLWHDAYRFILKKVKGDTLTEQEKVRLSEIAQQCSPEYGDAVHWARALASEYDDTDYTQYDNNCDNVDARARTSSPYISEQLSLSPNPVSNIITIRSTTDDEHELLLLGVDGQVIDKINFTGYDVEYNVSQYQNGVYFIKDLNTSELLKFIKL